MKASSHSISNTYLVAIVLLFGAGLLGTLVLDEKMFFLVALLPFGLVVAYLFAFRLNALFLLTALSLPVSLNFKDIGLGLGISIPGEGLTALLAVAAVGHIMNRKDEYIPILRHPLTQVIGIHLIWLFITSLTSTMPSVSMKFFIIRLVFVLAYYVLAVKIFSEVKNAERFTWAYMAGLTVVIAYTFYMHIPLGLTQETSNRICHPFYNDHTIYAACILMMVPLFIAFYFLDKAPLKRGLILVVLGILMVALIYSYSRASWLGFMGAIVGWLLFRFKISFKQIIIGALVAGSIGYTSWTAISSVLARNDTDSGGSVVEHAASSTNIETDASNTERINRWKCAYRMFEDKPLFGYGPGTYMFKYGPYQRVSERTIISVNDGSIGGAHSEYFKPLAESGLVGTLTLLAVMFYTIKVGMDVLHKSKDKKHRWIAEAATLSFFTYLVHGVVNFFLDTDKSSVLFWGMAAIIVALDLKRRQDEKKQLEKQ